MARILIAEDEEAVRTLVARGLEMDAIRSRRPRTGPPRSTRSAARTTHSVSYSLKMPVMDGIALALAATRDYPDLKILLMTGYADQRERASGLEGLVQGIIAKPFTLAELRFAVAAALVK